MKYLLIVIATYQTLATLVELPGGWIMFTDVDAYEWRLVKDEKEIEWRDSLPPNSYQLKLNNIKKLARFVCQKNQMQTLDLNYRRVGTSEWDRFEVICDD